MRILLSAHVFAPSVGGIEKVAEMLAGEFVRQGHVVRVVTRTPGGSGHTGGFEVIRRPSAVAMLRLLAWCDVCLHANISLRAAWPLLLLPRPWVVSHHVWISRRGFAGLLKRVVLRWARGIAASHALARDMDTPSVVVPNPYDDRQFRLLPGVARDRDVVFLGRLVSDKGVDTLIDALAITRREGCSLRATVIGDGPERDALQQSVLQQGLTDSVQFTGSLHGDALTQALNRHRMIVIPSRWQEPFGLVALEGLACGCLPVVAQSGGLPEAVGAAGLTFPIGDAEALAKLLTGLVRDPELMRQRLLAAPAHLEAHRLDRVAAAYLAILQEACGKPALLRPDHV